MALKYLYVPSAYKAATAYGVLPNATAADLTFGRASNGSRINKDKLIETESSNVPRLDYSGGSCPTLFTELQVTNLVKESENFTDSDWSKSNSTVTANATIDPQGGNNGFLVSLNTSQAYLNQAVSFLAEPTTFSVYLKSPTVAGTYPLNWYAANGGGHHRELVNVTTEWKRFEINFTPTGLGSRFIYIGDNRGAIGETLSSVYAWGAQVESSPKATSYIHTEASTVTRSADTGIVSGDLSSYINSTEGVLEFKASRSALKNAVISLSSSLTSGDNSVSLGFTTSTTVLFHKILSSGATVITQTPSVVSVDLTQMNVVKLKWKDGDFQAKINDTVFTIAESGGSLPFAATLKYLRIGYPNDTSQDFAGAIQYIKVYDSASDF
tara:strand:- start:767 stop:1912 length:1146 start_codon:yes stop_codon:yes gene_type:complete